MAEQTETGIVAVRSEMRDTAPWRSLLWFALLLGVSHFLAAPLLDLRMVVLVNFQLTHNSPLYFFTEVAGSVCVIGMLVQVTLATLCLAWSEGKLWQRSLVYGATLVIGGILWFAGYLVSAPLVAMLLEPRYQLISATQLGGEDGSLALFAVVASALPLVLVGVQFPFWIARVAGWRLVKPGAEHTRGRESLSIGDLMLATGVVGVCFALLQIARPFLTENAEDPLVFLAAVLGAAIVSAIIVTSIAWPLAWAFLKPLRWSVAWLTALGIAAGTSSLLSLLFLLMMNGITWQIVIGMSSLSFSYVGGVAAGVALLRRSGWQLAARREPRPPEGTRL